MDLVPQFLDVEVTVLQEIGQARQLRWIARALCGHLIDPEKNPGSGIPIGTWLPPGAGTSNTVTTAIISPYETQRSGTDI